MEAPVFEESCASLGGTISAPDWAHPCHICSGTGLGQGRMYHSEQCHQWPRFVPLGQSRDSQGLRELWGALVGNLARRPLGVAECLSPDRALQRQTTDERQQHSIHARTPCLRPFAAGWAPAQPLSVYVGRMPVPCGIPCAISAYRRVANADMLAAHDIAEHSIVVAIALPLIRRRCAKRAQRHTRVPGYRGRGAWG
jgi:hypothetical protein